MKKILKLAVLVFATTLIVTCCKKEDKDTIIGKWKLENNMKVNTTHNSQDPIIQAAANYLVQQLINDGRFSVIYSGTYEFSKDGKVVISQTFGSIEGTYSVSGDILSLTIEEETLKGVINISGKTMLWDLDMTWLLNEIDDDMLDILLEGFENLQSIGNIKDIIKGIAAITLQATFKK